MPILHSSLNNTDIWLPKLWWITLCLWGHYKSYWVLLYTDLTVGLDVSVLTRKGMCLAAGLFEARDCLPWCWLGVEASFCSLSTVYTCPSSSYTFWCPRKCQALKEQCLDAVTSISLFSSPESLKFLFIPPTIQDLKKKITTLGTGDMAPQLRALDALQEDPCSIPRTHMAARSCL